MKYKEKKRVSLKVTLTAGFLIFSAVLLITLWLFQTVFLDTFYKSVKTAQVKNCAASVCTNLENDDISTLISDIEEQNMMSVSIYVTTDSSFTPVYKSSLNTGLESFLSQNMMYDLYTCALDNGGEYSRITRSGVERRFTAKISDFGEAPTFDGDMFPDRDDDNDDDSDSDDNDNKPDLLFREPSLERESVSKIAYAKIVSYEDSDYFVVVESEITPVTSVVDTLRYQLIIMTAIIVAISVIIALVIARKIARPISDTNEKAKALADQNYDVDFGEGRYKEIKELNDTLTYAASELKKVDSLRKELIANISHDLRTPLTMITGYSEVMRDLPGEVTPENIQIIIDEANHLNSLVSDLLDISRLESGTADMNIAPFSLTDCIRNIFSRYTKLIEVEGYNISFEYNDEVFVNGDEMRITQVVYNLINNAVNYVGEDKTVIVRQTVGGNTVRIDVIDHGEGIPSDKLKYIWDRYYRVDKEHKQAKIGTGLGLSIVKNILKAHGAGFSVESEVGKGSDFYFEMQIWNG